MPGACDNPPPLGYGCGAPSTSDGDDHCDSCSGRGDHFSLDLDLLARKVQDRWDKGEDRVIVDHQYSWDMFRDGMDGAQAQCVAKYPAGHSCLGPGWGGEVPAAHTNMRRFRIRSHAECPGCPLGRGNLEEGLHILMRVCDPNLTKDLWGVVRWVKDKTLGMCRCQLANYLKQMTGIMKRGGRFITPAWKYCCYWETMFGYVPSLGVDAHFDEVFSWAGVKKVMAVGVGSDWFTGAIYEATLTYFNENWKWPETFPPTVEDFVNQGTWVRGKSGTGQTTTVEVGAKTVRTRRMRGVDAAIMSDEEMVEKILTPAQEVFILGEKNEAGKVRPVFKSGNPINRQMDMVGNLLERGLYGSASSTLFSGNAVAERIDEEILATVLDGGLYKVPMDQSQFDNNQGMDIIKAVFVAMGDFLESIGAPPDYLRVWELIYDGLFVTPVWVHVGNRKFLWCSGVPSGWRWTAFVDTLLNIAEGRVLESLVELITREAFIRKATIRQGDDVQMATPSLTHSRVLMSLYNIFGFEVHPHKGFISLERTEYLRRCFDSQGITGYPARTIVSLRFRHPVANDPVCPATRVSARLSQWLLLDTRVGSVATAECYLEDAHQLGVPEEIAATFALTPSSVGGGGIVKWHPWYPYLRSKSKEVRWAHLDIRTQKKDVKADLSVWRKRLAERHITLDNYVWDSLAPVMATAWGVHPSVITEKVSADWNTSPPHTSPYNIASIMTSSPIDLAAGWDDSVVPVMLRGAVRRSLLREGTWRNWYEPTLVPQAEMIQKKISINLFEALMLGEATTPVPALPGLSPKYGATLKAKAERMINRVTSIRSAGMTTLTSVMLSVEAWLAEAMRFAWGGKIWTT